jgi:hypothetical protein
MASMPAIFMAALAAAYTASMVRRATSALGSPALSSTIA